MSIPTAGNEPLGLLEPASDMDLEPGGEGSQAIAGKSPAQLARQRFLSDKLSMVSLVVVVFYVVAAIAAPILVKTGVLDPYTLHNFGTDNLLDVNTLPAQGWDGVTWHHLLGVEPGTGRDLLARVWLGIAYSLMVALSAAVIAVFIGVVLGIIAGFTGGWTDAVIGRVIDFTLSFPQTLLILALSSVGLAFIQEDLHIPKGVPAQAFYVIMLLGLFSWTNVARLVRGQVLSLREREFVEAAKMMGAGRLRMYFKEILPNLWAPIIVTFTLYLPAFVSAEAALAYLQVSIKPPTPTLGNVLTDSLNYGGTDFVYFFTPAFLIALIVVCFNLLGDGLRDALDPRGNR